MRVLLTFSFPETGETKPDVALETSELALIPLPGDHIAAETYSGKQVLRQVVRRTFSYAKDDCVVMLTCH